MAEHEKDFPGEVKVRWDGDQDMFKGDVDEIFGPGFSLEVMDDDHVWMRIGDLMVNLYAERAGKGRGRLKLTIRAEWDGPR